MVRALIHPQKIPEVFPHSCLSFSDSFGLDNIACIEEPGKFDGETPDVAFNEWLSTAEVSSSNILMLDGAERARACSRSRGHRMCWQSAIGRPGSNSSRVS